MGGDDFGLVLLGSSQGFAAYQPAPSERVTRSLKVLPRVVFLGTK